MICAKSHLTSICPLCEVPLDFPSYVFRAKESEDATIGGRYQHSPTVAVASPI
jgi:hypothetical protein